MGRLDYLAARDYFKVRGSNEGGEPSLDWLFVWWTWWNCEENQCLPQSPITRVSCWLQSQEVGCNECQGKGNWQGWAQFVDASNEKTKWNEEEYGCSEVEHDEVWGCWFNLGLWNVASFCKKGGIWMCEFPLFPGNGGTRIYWFNFECNTFSSACFVWKVARLREQFQVMREAAKIDGCGWKWQQFSGRNVAENWWKFLLGGNVNAGVFLFDGNPRAVRGERGLLWPLVIIVVVVTDLNKK